jgi:superfamily II DNA helicase RecQ
MVVDPLKSLMKRPIDGLINSGIDCVTFLTQFNNSGAKRKRKQLESSQLLIIFLA